MCSRGFESPCVFKGLMKLVSGEPTHSRGKRSYSSWGNDVPTTQHRREQNNNKLGDLTEVTQVQAASLDFKAYKRYYNYNSL